MGEASVWKSLPAHLSFNGTSGAKFNLLAMFGCSDFFDLFELYGRDFGEMARRSF
jgi:hypothetical protein